MRARCSNGRLARGFHVEMRLAGMFGLQRPGAILATFCLEDLQRILHPGKPRPQWPAGWRSGQELRTPALCDDARPYVGPLLAKQVAIDLVLDSGIAVQQPQRSGDSRWHPLGSSSRPAFRR